ncbi:hypothetical protein M5689_016845 [Euphorbia peplus]|nr:hypothetical protein M5689_016845 [Euphorbia peplus]
MRLTTFRRVQANSEDLYPDKFSDREVAEHALKLINEKVNGELQLEKTYGSYAWDIRFNGDADALGFENWCHVSFIAKPIPGIGDESAKLIFAEMVNCKKKRVYDLKGHVVLDIHDPGITYGCRFCPPDNNHPHPRPENYSVGHGTYMPHSSWGSRSCIYAQGLGDEDSVRPFSSSPCFRHYPVKS